MSDHPEELLSAYVDGELDVDRLAAVKQHLESCAACREIVESIRTLARNASSEPLDEVTTRRFLLEHRKRREESASAERRAAGAPGGRLLKLARPARFYVMKPLLVAASVAVVIVLATLIGSFDGSMQKMFVDPAGGETMGQNQAALSAGIYN